MPSLSDLIKEEMKKQTKEKKKEVIQEEPFTISKKEIEGELQITSDNFRTAYKLIIGNTSRDTIHQIFNKLRRLFNDYIIMKIGKDYYFVKKKD